MRPLVHHHDTRMNAHLHGQAEPFVLFQARIQGAECFDHA
jgi:hypothetical protein